VLEVIDNLFIRMTVFVRYLVEYRHRRFPGARAARHGALFIKTDIIFFILNSPSLSAGSAIPPEHESSKLEQFSARRRGVLTISASTDVRVHRTPDYRKISRFFLLV
jgi:hypothetical protein